MANAFRYTRDGDYSDAHSMGVRTPFSDFVSDPTTSYRTGIVDGLFFVFDNAGGLGVMLQDAGTRDFIYSSDGLLADFSQNLVTVDLLGGDVGDVLIGGRSDDTLSGGAGDDVLEGGAGADAFDGGDGYDTVSYAGSTTPMLIGNIYQANGDASGDTFANIEAVRGTDFDDTFVFVGTYTLEGGGGADIFGGSTTTTVTYEHSASGVSVDLSGITANTGGDAQGDQLFDVNRLVGSTHNDTLIANTTDSYLNGNGGLDTITGGSGNDTIVVTGIWASVDGGDGTDRLVVRGPDGPTIRPDEGTISHVERIIVANDTILDLSRQLESVGPIKLNSQAGKFAAVAGTSGDDRIIGGLGDDIMTGGAGRDHLTGRGGADLFAFRESTGVRDVITDFSGHNGDGDRIDFSQLGAFSVVDRFSGGGAGEVRLTSIAPGVQLVLVDSDGDGKSDLSVRVNSADSLTSDDFVFGKAPPSAAFAASPVVEHMEFHAFVEAAHPIDGIVLG